LTVFLKYKLFIFSVGTVQLYHSHSGNTIKDIEEELKTMLKNHLKDVKFVKCSRITDIDQSQMLIVLSIIASRVGTDAANAIKDVPRAYNIHHCLLI
jgi:hypothetical protein